MERFEVIYANDNKIILQDDRQLETLFKEIANDQNFIVEWFEKNQKRTKLFLADGLMSRLKDGRLVLEARKNLEEDDKNYDADYEEEEEE